MRLAAVAVLLSATVSCSQVVLLDPGKIAEAERLLESPAGDSLECDVAPKKPQVHFSLRLEAGYIYQVPMRQFRGRGHGWTVLTRVTPEGGIPIYLADTVQLPVIPQTTLLAEGAGSFYVGEGRYAARWLLLDDQGRSCRTVWKMRARLGAGLRKVDPLVPPGKVAGISWSAPPSSRAASAPRSRLTILLDVASLNGYGVMHSASDVGTLLDALWALIQHLPATRIKLVAFHLAQQKVIFERDDFTVGAMPELARAINELQPSLVDYRILQRPRGEVDLVESLANTEALAAPPSEAVIFLGPKVMYTERIPRSPDPPPAMPRFFNVQCATSPYHAVGRTVGMARPDFANPRPDTPVFDGPPDLIENEVARWKGKTLYAGSPEEFIKAVADIQRAFLTPQRP